MLFIQMDAALYPDLVRAVFLVGSRTVQALLTAAAGLPDRREEER